MSKVRLLNGKPLMVGGKVALSDACCCPTITGCPSVTISGLTFCCVPSFISTNTTGGVGACCHFDGPCMDLVTRADCAAAGGIYRGDGSLCISNPCGSALVYEDDGNNPPLVLNDIKQCTTNLGATAPCDINCINTPTCTLLGLHTYASEGCTGSPVDLAVEIEVYVTHVNGVYHIFAINGGNNLILFYGATSEMSPLVATNEVICGSYIEYDNDGATCLFNGPITALGIAENGTATIGDACVLGACCSPSGDCLETPQNICEDCLGGTWRGTGTTCVPNPCVGACCVGVSCFPDTTEADCDGAGGTYQGDGTDCDPNPC